MQIILNQADVIIDGAAYSLQQIITEWMSNRQEIAFLETNQLDVGTLESMFKEGEQPQGQVVKLVGLGDHIPRFAFDQYPGEQFVMDRHVRIDQQPSVPAQASICFGSYRKDPGEEEHFTGALWHPDTMPQENERIVKGYFIPFEAADIDLDLHQWKHALRVESDRCGLDSFVAGNPEQTIKNIIENNVQLSMAGVAMVRDKIKDLFEEAQTEQLLSGNTSSRRLVHQGLRDAYQNCLNLLDDLLNLPQVIGYPNFEGFDKEEIKSPYNGWTITQYTSPKAETQLVYSYGGVELLTDPSLSKFVVKKHPTESKVNQQLTGNEQDVLFLIELECFTPVLEWTHVPKSIYAPEHWKTYTPFGYLSIRGDDEGWKIQEHCDKHFGHRKNYTYPQTAIRDAEARYFALVRKAAEAL